MKKIMAIFLLTEFILLFCACNSERERKDCLSYQEKAFEGEFQVSLGEFSFTALVFGDEWSSHSEKNRDISMEITAPSTLQGIMLARKNGDVSISLDGIDFQDEGGIYESLADFTSLLELDAVPLDFKVEGKNTRATFSSSGGESITLLLEKNGTPLEISDGTTTVKIKYYRIKK